MATTSFLGRYEAIRLLGEGAVGRVYLARDPNLARQVVVKVLHPQFAADPAFRQRFETETLLTAQFEHAHAVRVYDAGCDSVEGPCIIMEFLRGGITLADLLKKNRGRLNPARIYRLLTQLCEVLQTAHDQGIIHRDLKPTNLMVVDHDSPSEKIKVLDFGLAKICTPSSKARSSGAGIGTPSYMSPEQGRGLAVDHRTDLYSVGVILYQAVTGRLPFTGASAVEIMLAHTQEEPPTFVDLGDIGTIPWSVEDVIRACLEKDPAKRPANAMELAEQYKAALTGEPLRLPATITEAAKEPEANSPEAQIKIYPDAVVYHMEASLSRSVAEYKLRGFVSDAGGKVVESVPGLIRVRLGEPDSRYERSAGALSWLGFGRDAGLMEVYLYLRQKDPKRPDLQTITVLMLSLKKYTAENPSWQKHCSRIYSDLRGYLMGHDVKGKVGS